MIEFILVIFLTKSPIFLNILKGERAEKGYYASHLHRGLEMLMVNKLSLRSSLNFQM